MVNSLMLFLAFIGIFGVMTRYGQAQVYEWVDKKGIRHFSSVPSHQNAQPAELPPIMREKSLRARPTLNNCTGHKGVDCKAGPDIDGSVICGDGFKSSKASFRFHCHAAKLSVSEITEVNQKGEAKIFVRNERPVSATAPKLSIARAEGVTITAEGPSLIQGNSLEEFTVRGLAPTLESIQLEQITLECENCDP